MAEETWARIPARTNFLFFFDVGYYKNRIYLNNHKQNCFHLEADRSPSILFVEIAEEYLGLSLHLQFLEERDDISTNCQKPFGVFENLRNL